MKWLNIAKTSTLKSYLFEPPNNPLSNSRLWKYGFLAVIAALFGFQIETILTSPTPFETINLTGLAVLLSLLLNQISSFFWLGPRWSPIVRTANILWGMAILPTIVILHHRA